LKIEIMEKFTTNNNIQADAWIVPPGNEKKGPKGETKLIHLETELRSILNPNIQIKLNNEQTKKEL
jgi:hypothetical protein